MCKFSDLDLSQLPLHSSNGDCLEVKREYYQNSSVLDCVTQNVHSPQHTYYEQFLQVKQIGFVTLGPLHCAYRDGCLELYYCNMVEWFWCDSSLISTTNWFPSVLLHRTLFHHPACKNRPWNDHVSSATLNHTHSLKTLTVIQGQRSWWKSIAQGGIVFEFHWAHLGTCRHFTDICY